MSIAPQRDGADPGCQLPHSVSASKTTPLVLVYHTTLEYRWRSQSRRLYVNPLPILVTGEISNSHPIHLGRKRVRKCR